MLLKICESRGCFWNFAPELEAMYGVTQNIYHIYDVWTHSLKALESLPQSSTLTLRLRGSLS